jgi:hypothetical protein
MMTKMCDAGNKIRPAGNNHHKDMTEKEENKRHCEEKGSTLTRIRRIRQICFDNTQEI